MGTCMYTIPLLLRRPSISFIPSRTFSSSRRFPTICTPIMANRQTVHLVGVIADISVILNLVPWPECTREFIERVVCARDGHNASGLGVVERQYDHKKERKKIRY